MVAVGAVGERDAELGQMRVGRLGNPHQDEPSNERFVEAQKSGILGIPGRLDARRPLVLPSTPMASHTAKGDVRDTHGVTFTCEERVISRSQSYYSPPWV